MILRCDNCGEVFRLTETEYDSDSFSCPVCGENNRDCFDELYDNGCSDALDEYLDKPRNEADILF